MGQKETEQVPGAQKLAACGVEKRELLKRLVDRVRAMESHTKAVPMQTDRDFPYFLTDFMDLVGYVPDGEVSVTHAITTVKNDPHYIRVVREGTSYTPVVELSSAEAMEDVEYTHGKGLVVRQVGRIIKGSNSGLYFSHVTMRQEPAHPFVLSSVDARNLAVHMLTSYRDMDRSRKKPSLVRQ